MTLVGCSVSTSMCLIDAVSSDGAETSASRRVASREHLGRRAKRLLDLVAHRAEVDPERVGTAFERVDELLGVQAVAALRRRPSGRRVRMRQQTEVLELGELAAHRRRREVETGALDERARADRLAGRDVLLDDEPQDLALPGCELHLGPMVAGSSAVSRRALGEQLGGDPATEEAAARREPDLVTASVRRHARRMPRSDRRTERPSSKAPATSASTTRLVETQPEQETLASRVSASIGSTSRGGASPRASAPT